MATRALVGYINDQNELVSTYNHFDGYPDSLGAGLDRHYGEPNEAVKIASMGYISFLDPETGEIEAKHKEPAEITPLSREFDEAMREIYSTADSYGADYIYLYDFENMEWVNARVAGSQKVVNAFSMSGIVDQFDSYEGGDLADEESINMMEEDYKVKWESFITENSAIDNQWTAYVKSLVNDIRLNGVGDYVDYSEDDFKEDFDNYIGDKMGM